MNKILTTFICALVSTGVYASDAKKKSEIYVTAETRNLNAPYGQPVKVSGAHTLVFKNIFNANMTYEYGYSLQVNAQHFNKRGVITLSPYSERRLDLESDIYNIVFQRGKYGIIACTATQETGTVCDYKTLTVY